MIIAILVIVTGIVVGVIVKKRLERLARLKGTFSGQSVVIELRQIDDSVYLDAQELRGGWDTGWSSSQFFSETQENGQAAIVRSENDDIIIIQYGNIIQRFLVGSDGLRSVP